MKKILILLLCIFLLFTFIACDNTDSDYEVYVSKSGKKVHSIPNCSGMKYYYTMTYSEAVKKGYAFCKNCN